MSLITFSAFRTAINTLVFPDGQAEVRVPLFRNFIVNALIQLQTFVESYQLVNVNFYDKDQSWDDCGLSILQACRGRIGAVYAFKPSCRCQRHFYDSASLEKLSCLYEHCRCHQTGSCCCGQSMFSSPSLYTANPYYCGDYVGGNTGCQPPYLAAQPEDDCAFKLSDKFFAVGPNQKLWLFPRFPCGYVVGVHWRGIRRSYLDNDYVPDDDDLKDAVATYVESELARRVDKDQATADKLYADYRMKAGDIIFREEQDLKPRATRVCVEGLDLSELVQIYPDNPYPVDVGEFCATGGAAAPEPEPFSETDTLFWWPFEEGTSAARVDVVHGIPMWPTGFGSILTEQSSAKVGNGVRFVPSVNANIGLVTALDAVTAATGGGLFTELAYSGGGMDFMFWMKIDVEVVNMQPIPVDYRVFDIGENLLGRLSLDFLWGLAIRAFCSNNGDSVSLDFPVIPPIGAWHAWRVFYDPSDSKIGIQLDGGMISRSASTISFPQSVSGKLTTWELGTGGGGTQTDFKVDELTARIGSLFTAAEVASYYNSGAGRTFP